MATILCLEHRPQMGTVRPKVFKKSEQDFSKNGEIIRVTSSVKKEDIRTKFIELRQNSAVSCNLEEVKIIMAGGRGMGKAENFRLVEELAELLADWLEFLARRLTQAGTIFCAMRHHLEILILS